MKTETVTYYIADDGAKFTTEDGATAHEALTAEVAAILAPLAKRPTDTGLQFENGHGHIPHDADVLRAVRGELAELGQRVCPTFDSWPAFADGTCHPSWPGRFVDDCGPSALREPIYRFMCIDGQGREWGQPYYAANPPSGADAEAIR